MRDLFIIGIVAVAAVGVGTFLYFLGPTTINSDVNQAIVSTQAPSDVVPITILVEGTNTISIDKPVNYRIQNTADLQTLWSLVYGPNNASKAPNINFNEYEVLGVFDGIHDTNGYSIKIIAVTDASSTRSVLVDHGSPADSCSLTSTPTSPFEIVEIPKTGLPIVHIDQMSTTTCP